jgi:tetratricopeptide (TPR) repeat protein
VARTKRRQRKPRSLSRRLRAGIEELNVKAEDLLDAEGNRVVDIGTMPGRRKLGGERPLKKPTSESGSDVGSRCQNRTSWEDSYSMRPRLPWSCIFAVAVLGLFPAGSQAAADPCTVGQAYLRAGVLDQAAAQFVKRIKRPCGRLGTRAVARERTNRANVAARSLRDAGFTADAQEQIKSAILGNPEARVPADLTSLLKGPTPFAVPQALQQAGLNDAGNKALEEAIKANPGLAVPSTLVALPRALADRHLARATALEDAGLHEAARDEVKEAINADPETPVPNRLKDENREPQWWGNVKSTLQPTATAVVELGLLALVLLLVIATVIRFRVNLGAFDAGDDKALAAGLPAALQDHISRITQENGGTELKLIKDSGEDTNDIQTALTTAGPQGALAGSVYAVLRRLAPARIWVVSGAVREFDDDGGVALTMAIRRRAGTLVDQVTLWQADFDPPGDPPSSDDTKDAYYRLARSAAVWTVYARGRRKRIRRWATFAKNWARGRVATRAFEIVGTHDWRSYALFANGVAYSERGEDDKARDLYWNALNCDPINEGAIFNLANSYLSDTSAKGPWKGGSQRRIDESLRWLDGIMDGRRIERDWDMLWHRSAYVAALGHFWKADRHLKGVDTKAEIARALEIALDSCHCLESRLARKKPLRVWRWGLDRAVKNFLSGSETSSLALLASIKLAAGLPDSGSTPARDHADLAARLAQGPNGISASDLIAYAEAGADHSEAHYDIACYYSSILGKSDSPEPTRTAALKSSFIRLRRALDLDPGMAGLAREDPDLSALHKADADTFDRILKDHRRRQEDEDSGAAEFLRRLFGAS